MGSQPASKQQKAEIAPVAAAPGRANVEPRSLGSNRALSRLFRMAGSGSFLAPPSLPVVPPNDVSEREADRVAGEVMRMPAGGPVVSHATAAPASVQRKCAGCEDEERRVRRAGEGAAPESAPPVVGEVLSSPGRPLAPEARHFFEPRFGADFSAVRVHDDARAAESAKAVNARAYTVGSEIAFAAGQYSPQTDRGRELLAHELAHVVQQPGPALQRQTDAGVPPAPATATPDAGTAGGTRYDDYFEGYFLVADPQRLKPMLAEMVAHHGKDAPTEFLNRYRSHVLQETSAAGVIAGVPDDPQVAARDAALRSVREALETAVQELQTEHDQFLRDFETNAKADALSILFENEQDAKREAVKYGITEKQIEEFVGDCDAMGCGGTNITTTEYEMSADNVAGKGLKDAAQVLLNRRREIEQLLRKQSSQTRLVRDPYEPKGMILEPTPEFHATGQEIQAKWQEYDILRGELSNRFPVLAAFSERGSGTGDLERLASAGPGRDMARLVGQQISERLGDIKKVRAALNDGELSVWRLPRVLAVTQGRLGIGEDPVKKKLVDEQVAASQPGMLEAFALLVFNVLMIALAPVTGGASLIPLAAVNTAVAVQHTKEYLLQAAVAGSAFDKARALSADEPSLFWLAVEIIGVGLDVGAAVAAFSNIARAIRAAGAIREARAAEELVANAARTAGGENLVQRVLGRFRASRQGENAGLRAAGATESEIQTLTQTTRAIEQEAAAVPKARASAAGVEASVTREGHLFCRSSPNLPCRLKYANELADAPELNARLTRLEEAARRATTAEEARRVAQEAAALQVELESKLILGKISANREAIRQLGSEGAELQRIYDLLRTNHRTGSRINLDVLTPEQRVVLAELSDVEDISQLTLAQVRDLRAAQVEEIGRQTRAALAEDARLIEQLRQAHIPIQDKLRAALPERLRQEVLDSARRAGTLPAGAVDVDHIVPLRQVLDIPGFSQLDFAEQAAIVNGRENLRAMNAAANRSRGARSIANWPEGTNYFNLEELRLLEQQENAARAAIQQRINELLARSGRASP